MKHFNNISLIAIAIASLYLLQSCGSGNYNAYIEEYKDIAISEMERTGYPASIKLAQAILESEGGRGLLAQEYNNHFGITCSRDWKGKKYYEEEEDFTSGEIVEVCYQVYSNPYSSFMEHTDMLRSDKHYRSLFRLDPMNYIAWAQELTALNYAGNQTYGNTLISIIEKNGLQEYDDRASSKTRPPTSTASRIEEDATIRDYDYTDARKRTEDRISSTRKRVEDEYRDRVSDLEADIREHNDKYRSSRNNDDGYSPSYRDDDYYDRNRQRSDQYGDKDEYEDNYRYPERDRYVSNKYEQDEDRDYNSSSRYKDRENSASRRRYESEDNRSKYEQQSYGYEDDKIATNRRERPGTNRSSSYTFDDSKYDGYKEEIRPSRSSHYDTYRADSRPTRSSNYNTPSNYENTPRRRQEVDENWLQDSDYNTSIDDFRTAEDYAYINNLKVTTARYDDTPLTIASRFNVSVKDILKYNERIKSNNQLLKENDKVYLQAKKKNYDNGKNYHIVQYGERMFDIAQMYGLSLNALYDKNRMPKNSEPAIGVKIKLNRGKVKKQPELRSNYKDSYHTPVPLTPPTRVPIKTQPVKVASTPITNNFPNNATVNQQIPTTTVLLQPVTTKVMYHTVQKGETLYRIAHQYGSSVESIKRMNNLDGNTLSRGMRLKVR